MHVNMVLLRMGFVICCIAAISQNLTTLDIGNNNMGSHAVAFGKAIVVSKV